MKVYAFVCGDSALVWDAEAIPYLREQWRVIGGLVGALPQSPRQNNQLGLPLKLMPEEVTLLREKGVLSLVQYSPHVPTEEEAKKFHQLRDQEFESQRCQYMRERRERDKEHHPTTSSSSEAGEAKRPRLDIEPSAISFSPLVHLHTSDHAPSSSHPPYDNWTYPDTSSDQLRYAVFSDLWHKGHYLTSALKYGGDYLVYSGDPAHVHSDYIAVVLPWQQPISSLVSLGRLGTKVKKNTLLCSIVNGEVHYTTLEWMGM